jgi:hypothetical protein
VPSINLSDKEYKKLLDLVYLGNWMINSFKIDDQVEEYEDLEQLILSKASDFNQQEYIFYDEDSEEYFTNRKFEDEIDEYIQEYDNYTFWDELANRLAIRDMRRQIGPVKTLNDEHWGIKYEIEEAYTQEFEKSELKNVIVEMERKTTRK